MKRSITFEIITLEWKQVEEIEELPEEPGLYQIYGTSPVYGMNTLLYIGQAEDLKRRVPDHFDEKSTIGRQPSKTCRYTKLETELLTAVEDILIVMHKPSFNSSRLINVSKMTKEIPLYIQNHGDRGMLNLETTNYYFINPSVLNSGKTGIEVPTDVR